MREEEADREEGDYWQDTATIEKERVNIILPGVVFSISRRNSSVPAQREAIMPSHRDIAMNQSGVSPSALNAMA